MYTLLHASTYLIIHPAILPYLTQTPYITRNVTGCMLFPISAKENPPQKLSSFMHTTDHSRGKRRIDGAAVPSSLAFVRETMANTFDAQICVRFKHFYKNDSAKIYISIFVTILPIQCVSNHSNRLIFALEKRCWKWTCHRNIATNIIAVFYGPTTFHSPWKTVFFVHAIGLGENWHWLWRGKNEL